MKSRKRPSHTRKRPCWVNMKACEAETMIPVLVLRKMKGLNCPNFRANGTIVKKGFKEWIVAHADEIKFENSLGAAKVSQEVRKLKRINDQEEGKLQDAETEAKWLLSLLLTFRSLLEQRLVNEYPGLVEGLDAPQIRVRGKKLFDELMAALQPLGERHAALLQKKPQAK